ncbi:GGDEF domain-containing protein [Fusibacter sp. 3D3]|uniref:GGDEF domain-containing protein n=1 Tax=Fusibacter sp. 3D3 TaxID=1048380 RepID=UPI000852E3FF|nr:GGDEF domain-containing protein [Fusibacter sp. 3D3]GAU76843.1 Bll4347 protein [Fusibacter sp. 3D3]
MAKKIKALAIEERLFVYMLVFGIVLGCLNLVNNVLIDFPFKANYKWLVLIVSSIIGVYMTLEERHVRKHVISLVKGVIFSEIIFVFLPDGWFYAGGATASTMGYAFLICISICFVCKGFQRVFFIAAEIITIILLLCINAFYPEIFLNTPTKVLFLDNLLQIPMTIIASSILLIVFSNAYRKEKQTLDAYSEILIQKNQALFEMTIKDDLTGLYNRRYIFDQLQSLWQSLESQEAIRLALVDVDNFKQVNDTKGHVIGDKILKQIASIMANGMTDNGFAGRYGGDEFVLVFIGSEIESVMATLSDMNTQIKSIEVGGGMKISLSGGVSRLTKSNHVDDALSRADDILYQSKKTSKDQIISDEIQNRL